MSAVETSRPPSVARFAGSVLALSVLLLAVRQVVDGGSTLVVDAETPRWLGKCLLDVSALSYVTARSRWRGARLVASLALVYAGLQALALVEVGLYGLVAWPTVWLASARSLAVAAVVVPAVAAAFGRLRGEPRAPVDDRLRLSAREWAWKVPTLAAAFLALFLFAGVVVFLGVARALDPVALASYEILDPPPWIFLFQTVRGLAYAALLVPVVYQLRTGPGETRLVAGLTLGFLVSSGVVVPSPDVPGLLWVAHFAELFVSTFLYGVVAAALLGSHHEPLAALRRRVAAGA